MRWRSCLIGFVCLITISIQQSIDDLFGIYNFDIDRIVATCQFESILNGTLETKYAQKKQEDKTIPTLDGFQNRVLLKRAYDRSIRQRPFECIAEKTKLYDMSGTGPTKEDIESHPSYQALHQTCLFQNNFYLPCDLDSRYRSIDGTCNNLQNHNWGSTLDCTKRLLPHFYEDVAGFRKSVFGGPLPNARQLSVDLHHDMNRPSHNFTTVFAFFGQFLDHDIADSPISSIDGYRLIECCPIKEDHHPQCSPIMISTNDFFYSDFNVTCFPVTRSAPCPTCTLDKRQQMSQVTAFIDASVTYGSIAEDGFDLRALDGTGKLKMQTGRTEKLMPENFEVDSDKCGSAARREFCFKAGDRRANLHTPLMSLHTLLFREHNRIAEELAKITNWNGEKLYQESRKIVGAQLQHIVYNEFLPPVLGQDIIAKYELQVQDYGRTLYNPYLDPTVLAEFNTVVFRLHSVISSIVSEFQVDEDKRLLRQQQFDSPPLYNGIIGPFLKGMAKSPSQMFDRFIVMDLTEFLYKERMGKFGFDLPAVNIQRGRDHGIAPYVYLAAYASEGKYDIKTFDDLSMDNLMPAENIEKLKSAYNDVRDIDPWVGVNMESVTPPMLMGPTMANIIAEQFRRLKFGDRFYFEHDDPISGFSDDQLNAIRKSSLAKIVCDNTETDIDPTVKVIQRRPLLLPSLDNPIVACSEIPELDLTKWRDQNVSY